MDSLKQIIPSGNPHLPPNPNAELQDACGEYLFNREDAFLVYASFCGDLSRTAHALNLAPCTVLKIADEDGWSKKLAPILELKQSSKPGDVERAMNRAISFVQAYRLKRFLDRIMHKLTSMDPDELNRYLFIETKLKTGESRTTLSMRPLADLATAFEKAHAMAYQALNDTASERVKRKDVNPNSDDSISDLHAKLAEAMAEVTSSKTPRAMLFDAQLHEAEQALRVRPMPPTHPNDNDDH